MSQKIMMSGAGVTLQEVNAGHRGRLPWQQRWDIHAEQVHSLVGREWGPGLPILVTKSGP
jgi:hypothetical protein